MYRFNSILWSGLDLLFPPICAGCGKRGLRWCNECQQTVTPIPEPICEVCGIPVAKNSQLCDRCQSSRPAYYALRSWVVFDGPVRGALHQLKYKGNMSLGETLAAPLAEFSTRLGWHVDLVVPVPLSDQRKKERGYNQVAMVALPFSIMRKWNYCPEALKRSRHTRTQVGLTAEERRANVLGAFSAENALVAGKSILLMDDVATTGSTLSSAAESLLAAGAKTVYTLTLARALPQHGLKIV